MDIKKEAENLVKNVDKEDVKKVVNQALDSKVADGVIEKINDKTKTVDIKKEDVKNVVNNVLK
jgi:PBP1b-binding outer membrane lipoprotein LpoB